MPLLKIAVSPVTLYTKQHCAHKRCFIRHYRQDEMEMKSTNHCRLLSHKGGVWKNESVRESFGSRWANKVKINAYYKTMKVFFYLVCMSTCCWGLPKPKYEPFIIHNRGTLKCCKLHTFSHTILKQYKVYTAVGSILVLDFEHSHTIWINHMTYVVQVQMYYSQPYSDTPCLFYHTEASLLLKPRLCISAATFAFMTA